MSDDGAGDGEALVECDEPPVAGGCDAVAAWAQGVGQSLAVAAGVSGERGGGGSGGSARERGGAAQRVREARGCLDVLGRALGPAREAEALLEALAQRGEEVEGAAGPEAPADEVALVLWQFFEVARLCYAVLAGPPGLARELGARCRQLGACVRSRPRGRAEEVRRAHRLPKDVREAVREHEEVSAKLAEESLDEEAVEAARTSLIGFCQWMQRDFEPAKHLQVVAAKLEAVERGEVRRLILNLPPRHGKSLLATRRFVAWILGRDPTTDVIVGTHSQDFADEIGGEIRDSVNSDMYQRVFPGVHCAPDSKAKKTFKVVRDVDGKEDTRAKRGVFKIYGRGGSPTGSGAKYLILDDLVGEKEADRDSPAMERDVRVALRQFRTRLGPRGAIVVINTRYSDRDVVGTLTTEWDRDGPWEIVSFPMFAEEAEDHALPDGATWHRDPGDILWPGRYPRHEVEALRDSLLRTAPEQWWAQFQCLIVPSVGAIVDLARFRRYRSLEVVRQCASRVVVSVDTSKGASAGARTAFTVWVESVGRVSGADGVYLVCAIFGVWQYPEIRSRAKDVCREWHPVTLLIEDESTGQSLIPDLRAATDWVRTPIVGVHPTKDKVTRMGVCTPQINDGQVWLPEVGSPWAQWLAEYEKELRFFPNAKLKDLVDSTSQFLNWRRENPVHSVVSAGRVTGNSTLQRALGGSWGAARAVVGPRSGY